MDLIQSLQSIGKFSGDFAWYRRTSVSESGVILATEANWHLTGWRIADDIALDSPSEIVHSASGKPLTTEEGNTTATIELTSAQVNAAYLKFIKDEARGQTFEFFLDAGRGDQRKYLELYVPLVRFRRSLKVTSGTRKPVIYIDVYSNLAARTPAADAGGSALPSGAHGIASNFYCGVDEYFTAYET